MSFIVNRGIGNSPLSLSPLTLPSHSPLSPITSFVAKLLIVFQRKRMFCVKSENYGAFCEIET